ncbi:E3 ubiquitin-protein ligase TRIM7-like [Podarcis lilfordi]|uniref:E3 ubiquitin-protein ligase TRIM7-like n=1 Tax=Podarcis lilfordi TaxID=74358 RepID=A0AA35JYD7_9SAUR|nr:E3 ubiquitin-protein ligase TRIM7-like [Podarcis lilfordi]
MAASGGPVQDLCEEATCPICLEYFRDPVIIPECGHNFCRSCLIQSWEKSEGEASCPQCRDRVEQSSIRRNQQLANVVEIAKKFSHLGGKEEAEGKGKICEKHQEPLKLFCQEEQSPICVLCNVSKEHKGHEVIPLEEASQEYKDQISSCLDNVRKEREKILVFKANTEKESEDLLKQTDAEREKMVVEFRQLHQFLEEQEKHILAQMAEVEKEIAAQREEHLARLSRELSSLDSLIREMEEKLQEPASELLQDIGSFLQRSQEKENLEDPPVAFPPALKWRIWDFCDMNPFLEGVMEKFRDTVEYGLQLQKENITLDPDTANPYLILSKDRKRYPLPSEEPKRIRVALNCEGRRVSFYDADTAVLLYTFLAASFSGETLQPFFYISRKAKLRLY